VTTHFGTSGLDTFCANKVERNDKDFSNMSFLIKYQCYEHKWKTMVTPKNTFINIVVKMKGVQVRGSKIDEEDVKGFAKQIDHIENILFDRCHFQGCSFLQLCEAIRLRNGKVSKSVFLQVTFG